MFAERQMAGRIVLIPGEAQELQGSDWLCVCVCVCVCVCEDGSDFSACLPV